MIIATIPFGVVIFNQFTFVEHYLTHHNFSIEQELSSCYAGKNTKAQSGGLIYLVPWANDFAHISQFCDPLFLLWQ